MGNQLIKIDVKLIKTKEDFFDKLDLLGPRMSLKQLEDFIFNAPSNVRESGEYQYLLGLYDGRTLHEDINIF